MGHPCCLLRSVGHPPSRCVAIPGVIFAEMTGANSGCLLCPVGHPCIGGCRRSRWVIPAVCCALWVILASVGVAMYGGLSLQMPEVNSDCPPSVGVAVLDGSSLLSFALGGSSLQMPEVNSDCFPLMGVAVLGVDLAEMTGANSGCLLCPVDYPCIGRCRHVWWVIPADARSQ